MMKNRVRDGCEDAEEAVLIGASLENMEKDSAFTTARLDEEGGGGGGGGGEEESYGKKEKKEKRKKERKKNVCD